MDAPARTVERGEPMNKTEILKILESAADKNGDVPMRLVRLAFEKIQEQKWIPVDEQLPEPYVDVIVTNGIGIYIGWIDPTDKGWRVDSESEYFMKDIIAWMPRPKEYMDEQE